MTLPYTQRWLGACASRDIERAQEALIGQLPPAIDTLRARKADGSLPFLSLPERVDDLAAIKRWAEETREHYRHLLVLGTGGSSLGGQTLLALNDGPFAESAVQFVDNIDPHSFDMLLAALPLEQTAILAVSKSGGTIEPLCQLFILHERLVSALGRERAANAITVVTVPDQNPLRRFAETEGCRIFDHDPALGGRFSVFSEVGLLPAAYGGLDVTKLREGAALAVTDGLQPQGGEAGRGAAMAVALMEDGYSISVLMAYCDRLRHLGHWYRQTWAESVGKEGKGSTPVPALGTVDQHSQLQLYLDGPRDKFVTLLTSPRKGVGPQIPVPEGEKSLDYLRGHTLGDVLDAHAVATAQTLAHHGCPVRVMDTAPLDERTLGSLMMHFMLETVFAAHLLGVNAFDQPAVEESKQLARVYLQK